VEANKTVKAIDKSIVVELLGGHWRKENLYNIRATLHVFSEASRRRK
jgi:hypothetical protein